MIRAVPRSVWGWAGLLAVAGAFVVARLEVTTSIAHFLGTQDELRRARVSELLSRSALSRTLILCVRGADGAEARAASAELAGWLRARPEVEEVRDGVEGEVGEALYGLYAPRRFGFVAPTEDEAAARITPEWLRARAAGLKDELRLPTGTWVKRLARADPWLLFPERLRALQGVRTGAVRLVDGRFMSEDGVWAILFVVTEAAPFETKAQAPFLADLEAQTETLDAAYDGRLEVERSGVHWVAASSERGIKADVTRISVLSTVGVILLVWVFFRSWRLLVLGLVPLGGGVVLAAAFGAAAFGQLHGLTLAFGATLIGIGIDYPVHLFNHHTLGSGRRGEALRRVWSGLRLGAFTTLVGFTGLAWTSFPGIREIAVFAAVGVVGALGTTRFLVAPLLPDGRRSVPVQQRAAAALEGWVGRVRGGWVVWVAALGVAVTGVPRLVWHDRMDALYRIEPGLKDEHERVRARVARADGARFVVVFGADLEQALWRNDQVARALSEVEAEGGVEAVRSVHRVIWSERAQRASVAGVQGVGGVVSETLAALEAEGFRASMFGPFAEELAVADQVAPLRWEDLEQTPVGGWATPFRLELEDGVGLVTFLEGVQDPAAIEVALEGIDGATYFDQYAFMGRVYGSYRVQVFQLIGVGLLAVLAVVWVRYRRARVWWGACAPAVVAAAATLGVLGWVGEPTHLLHVVSLLLVLSIGTDYGIFLAEEGGGLGATLLSNAIACATTVCAFGLLGLSSEPALRAIGWTVGIGVGLSWVLAALSAGRVSN